MKTNEDWINLYYNIITAEWNFATNINAENEEKKVQAFWIFNWLNLTFISMGFTVECFAAIGSLPQGNLQEFHEPISKLETVQRSWFATPI